MRLTVMMMSLLACASCATTPYSTNETVRYVRGRPGAFQKECEFRLHDTEDGRTITSETWRGSTTLKLFARYDQRDQLAFAEVELRKDGRKWRTVAHVVDGRATVVRGGQPAQEFDVPAGVIVTSAPDWTDTFLLCRRYDREQGGKQEFVALWIHAQRPAMRLTLTIERVGAAGDLDRYVIHLRGNSPYTAWADRTGKMVKLAHLPFKEGATNHLLLEGHEAAAHPLRPN